jgi:hypothetical protein
VLPPPPKEKNKDRPSQGRRLEKRISYSDIEKIWKLKVSPVFTVSRSLLILLLSLDFFLSASMKTRISFPVPSSWLP